ncbi:MAG: hypothetical protein ACC707_08205 [Thiohalomonadales bacterium]
MNVSKLKWIGTITGIAGASLLAANVDISGYGFILFVVSAISWIIAGWTMKEMSLVFLNIAFLIINGFGIYRWL